MTVKELIEDLEECGRDNTYFEIEGRFAKVLAEYIRNLQRELDDERTANYG